MNPALPDHDAASLDPLVVTSPTIRCGTTLLQRLLCSSPEALIYGELCGQDLDFLLQLCMVKMQIYTAKKPFYAETLRQVLQGKVNSWIPDLMPEMDGYLTAMNNGAFAGLRHCRDYALSVGRRVWGFKYPAWAPHRIQLLRRMMPRSRFICIHRNLRDCVKSAKAQNEVRTEEQLCVFCETWKTNLQFTLSVANDPSFLVLRHEEFATQKEEMLRRIAEFTGLQTIDPTVLDHKINGRDGGHTAPAELGEAEMRIVEETLASAQVQ